MNEVYAADLVAISAITSTAPQSYRLADKVREAGGIAVMGGTHVNFLPEEALEHADFVVVRGEGEFAFPGADRRHPDRARIRQDPEPLVPGRRARRAQSRASQDPRPRRQSHRRLRSHHGLETGRGHLRGHLARVPVLLHVLLGAGNVRPRLSHPLHQPRRMTPYELQMSAINAMAKFYAWPGIAQKVVKRSRCRSRPSSGARWVYSSSRTSTASAKPTNKPPPPKASGKPREPTS